MDSAPIVIFCYNRPNHLLNTIRSLKKCVGFSCSPLYVFSDGPKDAPDALLVAAVREVLRSEIPNAIVKNHDLNIGLACNIFNGVSEIVSEHKRVIVLEDDLVLHPLFLRFMNEALEIHESHKDIFQVAGHIFQAKLKGAGDRAQFLPWTTSWGWATWSRAWKKFDLNADGWEILARNKSVRKKFNLNNSYDFSTMLERQMVQNVNSWAIKWYWTVFKLGGQVIYPPYNLVDNSGFDAEASHGRGWLRDFNLKTINYSLSTRIVIPTEIKLDHQVYLDAVAGLWNSNGGWIGFLIDKLKNWIWRLKRLSM